MRKPSTKYAFAAALCLAIAAIVWAIVQDDDPPKPANEPTSQTATPHDLQTQLVRRGLEELEGRPSRPMPFAILHTQPERMPQRTRKAIARVLGGTTTFGLQFERAQLTRTTTGDAVWIVEGNAVICLTQASTGATACDTTTATRRHGLTLTVTKPNTNPRATPTDFVMLGLAPDWARSAIVSQRDAPTKTKQIPVTNNTLALRANGPIQVEKLVR